MNDTTFKLRVPTTELEQWKAKAGKRGLSAWIRERCNEAGDSTPPVKARRRTGSAGGGDGAEIDGDSGASSVLGSDSRITAQRPPVESRVPVEVTCPHRKRRGELCYKCDPKFGLPSLE